MLAFEIMGFQRHIFLSAKAQNYKKILFYCHLPALKFATIEYSKEHGSNTRPCIVSGILNE